MPKDINIVKASGKKEPFDPQKVINSLKRAGAEKDEIKAVLKSIYPKLKEGMTTKEIYKLVYDKLRSLDTRGNAVAESYSLKKAIKELGPTGYPFEKFVAGILDNIGYKSETNLIIKGECVSHEVDVLAKKTDGGGKVIETNIIEAKFHSKYGLKTKIKTALYVYARYLDLKKTTKPNPKIWLVTNTKVTSEVKKYASCKDLKIISWNYPKKDCLRRLISRSGLHPITSLNSLDKMTKETLLRNNVVFLKDIKDNKNLFPNKDKFNEISKEAERVIEVNRSGLKK